MCTLSSSGRTDSCCWTEPFSSKLYHDEVVGIMELVRTWKRVRTVTPRQYHLSEEDLVAVAVVADR